MTYYEVLNIKRNASDKDIKNAYRALAKKYHPDTYKGNKSVAEEKMKQINEAYDVLSNKESKNKYDEQFNVVKSETKKETNTSYYNYETYKSPEPKEADYRTYYNYSTDYEYEPEYEYEYDLSKLIDLFTGSKIKLMFIIIGLISILILLGNMVNRIKVEAESIFEYSQPIKETYPLEILHQNNYHVNETIVPENRVDKGIEVNIPQINSEDIQEQINKWEESFNKWYETDGKQYEEQLKDEINSLYQNLLDQIKVNN